MTPSLLSLTQRDHLLRDGDVIFSSIPNPLYQRIADATGSTASHVGILFRREDGSWWVAESKVPCVRYSTLDNFIGRSISEWHVVRRLHQPLTPVQAAALRQECDKRMGLLYHTGFRYESKRMFCSKFVHEVFRDALGVEVGRVETFGELLQRHPATSLRFWKIWFFGRIPWNRLTVTPASQLESSALTTVFESHPDAHPLRIKAAPVRHAL